LSLYSTLNITYSANHYSERFFWAVFFVLLPKDAKVIVPRGIFDDKVVSLILANVLTTVPVAWPLAIIGALVAFLREIGL